MRVVAPREFAFRNLHFHFRYIGFLMQFGSSCLDETVVPNGRTISEPHASACYCLV